VTKRRKAPRRASAREPGWQTPVVLVAMVLVVAFLVLSGPAVLRDRLWKALGPAVVLTVPALAGILWVAWRRPGLFLRRWNRWLAGLILTTDGLLFLSLFHPPDRSYTTAGMAGDLGHALREFFGAGSLASWSTFGAKVEVPAWGSLWGLILLALIGALAFDPRVTSGSLIRTSQRLGRAAGTVLARGRGRAAPTTPSATKAPEQGGPHEALQPPPTITPAPSLTRLSPPSIAQPWQLPSFELLDPGQPFSLDQAEAQGVATRLEQSLASYGIEAKVVEINPGPAVTQYGLEPGWLRHFREVKEANESGQPVVRQQEVSRTRVKVEAISALDKDLAVALAAPALRIQAPVPGKSYVGVEVPNAKTASVGLRSVMDTPAFGALSRKSKLALALGLGVGGQAGVADLSRLPHLLMAGATGSGKSVCLKAILTCLALTATPEQVRIVLIDPKRVEFVRWKALPHLLYPPIVEPVQVVRVFQELIAEMEQRYRLMAEAKVSDLPAFNQAAHVPLPYLAVLVDELADLMMTAPEEVEKGLTRLAQLGRSAGIHLVVATQRPSVDVVTGLIKANFPARISFNVATQTDSRVILDMVGAEKLLGHGDMLFLAPDASQPRRFQGCFVTEAEMDRVVGWWVGQAEPKVEGVPSLSRATTGAQVDRGPAPEAIP